LVDIAAVVSGDVQSESAVPAAQLVKKESELKGAGGSGEGEEAVEEQGLIR